MSYSVRGCRHAALNVTRYVLKAQAYNFYRMVTYLGVVLDAELFMGQHIHTWNNQRVIIYFTYQTLYIMHYIDNR